MEFSPEEKNQLEELVAKYKELKSRQPEMNHKAIELCYKLGYIPLELIDQISESEHLITRGNGAEPDQKITVFNDKALEKWRDERDQLESQYQPIITKIRELTFEELKNASGAAAFWLPDTGEILTEIRNTLTVTQFKQIIRAYIAKQEPTKVLDLRPLNVILDVGPIANADKLWNFLLSERGQAYEKERLEKKPNAPREYTILINSTKAGEPQTLEEADIFVIIQEKAAGYPPIEQYDREVLTAITTLYKYLESLGEIRKVMTAKQIYNAMRGTRNEEPTQAQKDKITASILKMRNIEIIIGNQNEPKIAKGKRQPYPDIDLNIKTFLNADIEVKAVNRERETRYAFEIFQYPVLAQIAETRGQLILIPYRAYSLPEGVYFTETTAAYRRYLLEEIDKLKKKVRNNPKMLYSTILEQAHIDIKNPPNRETIPRQKKLIHSILDNLQANGYIKSYLKEPDGVTINKKPKKPKTDKK